MSKQVKLTKREEEKIKQWALEQYRRDLADPNTIIVNFGYYIDGCTKMLDEKIKRQELRKKRQGQKPKE